MAKSVKALLPTAHHKLTTNGDATTFKPDVFDAELGPVFLYPGEKRADFNSLRDRVFHASKPKDGIEALSCREVAILIWEIARYHRIRASKLKAKLIRILLELIRNFDTEEYDHLSEKVHSIVNGGNTQSEELSEFLEKQDKSFDDIVAQAYFEAKHDIQICDDKIEKLHHQVDRLLSDLDKRRDAFRRRLDETRKSIELDYDGGNIEQHAGENAAGHVIDLKTVTDVTPKKRKSSTVPKTKITDEPHLPGLDEPT